MARVVKRWNWARILDGFIFFGMGGISLGIMVWIFILATNQ